MEGKEGDCRKQEENIGSKAQGDECVDGNDEKDDEKGNDLGEVKV